MKNSFVLYTDYKQQIDCLSREQKGDLLDAIFQYAEKMTDESVEVVLDDVTKMAFGFIKAQLDRDYKKYLEISEKRSIAGSKGGAPKGNKNASKQASAYFDKQNKQMKAKQAKQPVNDNDNDNENVTDKDNDNDINKPKLFLGRTIYGANGRVTLTKRERATLIYQYGQETIEQAIAYLDNYKTEKDFYPEEGYSDYDAIIKWVIKAAAGSEKIKKVNNFNNFVQNHYSAEEMKELEEKLLEN